MSECVSEAGTRWVSRPLLSGAGGVRPGGGEDRVM